MRLARCSRVLVAGWCCASAFFVFRPTNLHRPFLFYLFLFLFVDDIPNGISFALNMCLVYLLYVKFNRDIGTLILLCVEIFHSG